MGFSADQIAAQLLRTPSAGLRVCANRAALAHRLAGVLETVMRANPRALSPPEIARLAAADYRVIALRLHAHTEDVGCKRARAERPDGPPARVREVTGLEELESADSATVLVFDPRRRAEIDAFIAAAGGHPGAAVERGLDLPGCNAVFRDGVVKRWRLPGGTTVVSKRDNRRKPGGVVRELKSLELILRRLRCPGGGIVPLPGGGAIRLDLPLAAFWDPGTEAAYALWADDPSPTLEELLLNPNVGAAQRRRLLEQCRRCLDLLFDCGVVWRDMSPRNILFRRIEEEVGELHLVDFEKVEVFDRPLGWGERKEVCRAQLCVEEFGVLCGEAELLETFKGLFDPRGWDLKSEAPLPHAPRAELAAVLAGRGVSEPVGVGMFNRLDKSVYEVRRPRSRVSDGRTILPGLLGFRVEHYLSLSPNFDGAEYDRRTTEALLAAHAADRLFAVFDLLWTCLAELEAAILVREFEAILRDGDSRSLNYPSEEARTLCDMIDRLLVCASPREFDAVVEAAGHE